MNLTIKGYTLYDSYMENKRLIPGKCMNAVLEHLKPYLTDCSFCVCCVLDLLEIWEKGYIN